MLVLTSMDDAHTVEFGNPINEMADTLFPPAWAKGYVRAFDMFTRCGKPA